ncbi:MAG: hypothetical protein H0W86_13370 [Armatimonadetes bacterium]|nr:hypothetical protein [Armatimonadota bacterium]
MTEDFQFVHEGRTFFCTVEAPRHAGMPPWWWFHLDDKDRGTRYAPFAASAGDTKKSVQTRIIAFYAEMMAIAARPVHQRNHTSTWQRPKPAVPAEAPAAAIPAVVEA